MRGRFVGDVGTACSERPLFFLSDFEKKIEIGF